MKTTTKLWIGIGVLILLSPLGLWLPGHFKAGDAWGEWGTDTFKGLIGYIPEGLGRLASLWRAPLPDYSFRGWEEKGLPFSGFAYIISALMGIAVTAVIIFFIGRKFTYKK